MVAPMLQVRGLELADVPVVEQIARRLHPRTAFRHMRYDRATFLETLTRIVSMPETLFGQVITHHDQPVGFLLGEVTKSWFGPDSWAHDILLCVEPAYEGRVGRQLVELTRGYTAWAEDRGARMKFLGVATEIHAATTGKIFERLGFPQIGTIHCAKAA